MWTSKGKIQDKNIIDSNIYAKIADNEVITGNYTFAASAQFQSAVGIGTNAPAYKLNVRNDLGVVAGEYAIAKFERPAGNWTGVHLGYYADGTADLGGAIFGNAAKPLYFGDTNDTRMMTIKSGNVGIGTTSPSAAFVVGSGGGSKSVVVDAGASQWAGFRLDKANTETWFIGTSNENENLNFRRSGSTNDMTISTAGNVGIGTAAPQARLDIVGGTTSSSAIGGRQINFGTTHRSTSGRTSFLAHIVNNYTGDDTNAEFYAVYPFDTGGNAGHKVFRSAAGAALVDMFYTRQDGAAYFAGNVGMGTSVPNTNKLQVVGSVGVNGNAGFGTTAPSRRVDLAFTNTDVYSAANIGASGDGVRIYNTSTDNNTFTKINFVNRSSSTTQGGIASITPAGNYSDMAFIVEVNNTPTETVRLSGDGSTRVGASTSDCTIFEKTGFMTASGSALVWRDDNMAAISLGTVATAPDNIALSGSSILIKGFDGNALTEQLYWSNEINHYYAEGTDIYPHLHVVPTTNNTGTIQFGMDYVMLNGAGSIAGAQVTITGEVDVAANSAWVHHVIELQSINGSALKMGDQLSMRIYRDPGNDTYPDDAGLITAGLHYQQNSLGSRNKFTK